MATRLDSIAPDLSQLIEQASPDRQRRIAVAAAQLAADTAQLDDPASRGALEAVGSAVWGESSRRQAVLELVDRLDEAAWDAQERAEEHGGSQDEYTAAFRAARAASAVAFALSGDPAEAALEAVYEAEAATADLPRVRAAVEQAAAGS